jgi:hypothetical protein
VFVNLKINSDLGKNSGHFVDMMNVKDLTNQTGPAGYENVVVANTAPLENVA